MPRNTIRILGENIAIGDCVAVTFSTPSTVALVAMVGEVKRIRQFDEVTGDMLDPIQIWLEDVRTRILVGPLNRDQFSSIGVADGPWVAPQEMRECGHDPGVQDCDDLAVPVYRSAMT